MSIAQARPKSMKIDLARGVITLTFEARLNADNQEESEALVKYRDPELPAGTLTFDPMQPGLFTKEIK